MRVGLVLFVLLAWAPVGAAQSAIVLTPAADAAPASHERARFGAIEALAERGIRLVRTPDTEICAEPRCAASMASEAAVDWVLILHVEPAAEGGEQVRVVLVSVNDEPREATATVLDTDAHGAATMAITEVLDLAVEPQHGFLMVRTDPPGAPIEIDGEAAGTSPLRRMVLPGEHTVRAMPLDGEPVQQTVNVAPRQETPIEIDLAAHDEEDDAPPPATAATRSEPSPINWILGGGLGVAGVVTLISPLTTIGREGDCVEEIERAGCVEMVHFGAQSGVLLGVGIALLVGAVVVDAVAPIRVDVQVSETAGRILVGGHF